MQASLQRKRLNAVNIGRKPAIRKLPSETKKEKKQKAAIFGWSMTEQRENDMNFEDEKDYIMRIIKELVSVLISLILGKKYVAVEPEIQNKYEVSGKKLGEYYALIDRGEIDAAENRLLEKIDYTSKEEVAAAVLFYRYLSEKEESFLKDHDFSKEEVLDGLHRIARNAGYSEALELIQQ